MYKNLNSNGILKFPDTVVIQSFRTDMFAQARPSLIRIYTVCHSVCIFWTYYSMVKAHCSNLRKLQKLQQISLVSECLGYSLNHCLNAIFTFFSLIKEFLVYLMTALVVMG